MKISELLIIVLVFLSIIVMAVFFKLPRIRTAKVSAQSSEAVMTYGAIGGGMIGGELPIGRTSMVPTVVISQLGIGNGAIPGTPSFYSIGKGGHPAIYGITPVFNDYTIEWLPDLSEMFSSNWSNLSAWEYMGQEYWFGQQEMSASSTNFFYNSVWNLIPVSSGWEPCNEIKTLPFMQTKTELWKYSWPNLPISY